MPATAPQVTALYDRHVGLGAKLGDFGGWSMPLEYAGAGVVAEHTAVRTAAGVFDVSHMGRLVVSGRGAVEWLNGLLTNDLRRIVPGRAQYSMLCDDAGGVVDDLLVYRRTDEDLLVVPNAANAATVLNILDGASLPGIVVRPAAPGGILAVQGPTSAQLLDAIGLPSALDYLELTAAAWRGTPLVVARSGYTGELGFELFAPTDLLGPLWDALLEAGRPQGVLAAGLGARDTLRTEMGYPLHGHELGRDTSPVQAGLRWAVGWDKPFFHGRAALVAERDRGPARALRGLLALDRSIPRPGMLVRHRDATVGTVSSGTFSPTLRQGIGLALLSPSVAVGDDVVVDVRGREGRFAVVTPPFVASRPR